MPAPALDPALAAKPKRIEFPYLDGLRGLAAISVVFYHAYLFTGKTGQAYAELPQLKPLLGWGYLGVPLFIVLSGYVLMLPVVQRPGLSSGGILKFLRRRAKRILPPYYGALIISLLLIWLIPVMGQIGHTQWDSKIPVTWQTTLSHFLMLHDLRSSWIGKINGPLWSVAVEWQIYFLMPLILLPLWRVVTGWVLVPVLLVATIWLGHNGILTWVHPWFVALFALGMLAAQITVKGWLRLPFRIIVGPAVLVTFGLMFSKRDFFQHQTWPSEILFGIMAAVVLIWVGQRVLAGQHSRLADLLEWKPLMLLGLVSYSVYLLHSPLLGLGNLLFLPLGLAPANQFKVMIFVVVPLALACCVAFYWLIERNFKNARQKHATSREERALRVGGVEPNVLKQGD